MTGQVVCRPPQCQALQSHSCPSSSRRRPSPPHNVITPSSNYTPRPTKTIRQVMDIARASGRVCREAFHNAEHPANKHVAALIQVIWAGAVSGISH